MSRFKRKKSKEKEPQPNPIPSNIIIQANPEGIKAIQMLCDVALKVGGLQNYQSVTHILRSTTPLPPQENKQEEPDKE